MNADAPIRLAMILPGLGRVRRGAETAFVEIARRLAAEPDFRVTLFGMGHEGLEGLDHVVVHAPDRDRFRRWPRLPAFRHFMAWEEFFFAMSMRASGQFRPSQFDLAIGCSYPWVPWVVRGLPFRRRPKFVFVTQNGDWPVHAGNREYRFFGCDGLVCVSPEHEARCRGRFPKTIIGNGVDTAKFRPIAANESRMLSPELEAHLPGPDDTRKIVLVCAALTPEKRVDAAIRAVAEVPGAFLLVVGEGPLRDKLAALAGALLPKRHFMAGSLPTDVMPALYRRADALLHMNAHEPFGIIYLEAAATALPVVAPDVPTARWILADTAAYFPEVDRPDQVAAALKGVLGTPAGHDLGQAARRRAEAEWTWDAQAARYATFLRSVNGPTIQPLRIAADNQPQPPEFRDTHE
jgi:glycosyltransferase involved in cell wall biosynthesis